MAKSEPQKFQLPLRLEAGAEKQSSNISVVRLEQTAGGMWKVRDRANLRGGLFRDYRSAVRFIKHEFQLLQPSPVVV